MECYHSVVLPSFSLDSYALPIYLDILSSFNQIMDKVRRNMLVFLNCDVLELEIEDNNEKPYCGYAFFCFLWLCLQVL